jgi:hypothetical protein
MNKSVKENKIKIAFKAGFFKAAAELGIDNNFTNKLYNKRAGWLKQYIK